MMEVWYAIVASALTMAVIALIVAVIIWMFKGE